MSELTLNSVSFPRKGKGQKNQTYTASVIGTAKVSQKKGKFLRLDYSTVKSIREAAIRSLCDSQEVDIVEALARGYDSIIRMRASGGSSLSDVIIARLTNDKVCHWLDDKSRGVKHRALASTILQMKRQMQSWSLDKCYETVVAEQVQE